MTSRCWLAASLALALWLTASPALAAPAMPMVLRVGTTGDYPPFSFRDPVNGQWRGSDIEAAESLGRALGRQVEFVGTSWRSLMADQLAGRFDIAMGGISVTPERERQAAFSIPYLRDGKSAVVRCQDRARWGSLALLDRPEVRLVENPGGTNEAFARKRLPHASLRIHDSNLDIFDEILAGRADAMVTDAVEGRMQQRLRPGLCVLHPERPFDTAYKAYLLPRSSEIKSDVDRWLRAEQASGRASERLERWLAYPWPLATAPAVRLARLVDERLALMPDVARYKWNRRQAIEDPPREEALLDSIKAQAPRHGVDPERAVAFFAAQIEASKRLQRELFFAWQANDQGEFAGTRDLATDIRPKLDALNPRLLDALAAFEGRADRRAFGPLQSTATSAAAVDAALAPLLR